MERDEEAVPHLSRKINNLLILVYECGPVPVQKYMCLDHKEGGKRVGRDEGAVRRLVQRDEGSLCMNVDLSPCSEVHVPRSEGGWKESGER